MLENAGPPPSDTSVTFRTGERRVIILGHGPPDNITFARLDFAPESFGEGTGREVRVELNPRPGLYALDITSTLPFSAGATLSFYYARYFTAPARASRSTATTSPSSGRSRSGRCSPATSSRRCHRLVPRWMS